jgi:hypothetical protein
MEASEEHPRPAVAVISEEESLELPSGKVEPETQLKSGSEDMTQEQRNEICNQVFEKLNVKTNEEIVEEESINRHLHTMSIIDYVSLPSSFVIVSSSEQMNKIQCMVKEKSFLWKFLQSTFDNEKVKMALINLIESTGMDSDDIKSIDCSRLKRARTKDGKMMILGIPLEIAQAAVNFLRLDFAKANIGRADFMQLAKDESTVFKKSLDLSGCSREELECLLIALRFSTHTIRNLLAEFDTQPKAVLRTINLIILEMLGHNRAVLESEAKLLDDMNLETEPERREEQPSESEPKTELEEHKASSISGEEEKEEETPTVPNETPPEATNGTSEHPNPELEATEETQKWQHRSPDTLLEKLEKIISVIEKEVTTRERDAESQRLVLKSFDYIKEMLHNPGFVETYMTKDGHGVFNLSLRARNDYAASLSAQIFLTILTIYKTFVPGIEEEEGEVINSTIIDGFRTLACIVSNLDNPNL